MTYDEDHHFKNYASEKTRKLYNEIKDRIRAFWKRKKRLNKMGEENMFPGREKYKIQIIDLINSRKSKKKKKTTRGNWFAYTVEES